ncbi:type I-E CRISPR-associated protein Cas5/CasD [Streptomyces mutabilis]|uniref:type I-E CRISPR-associated protein Cas5/CasD n=1 Tax=Streptomyces mutabilis TaxID=67332 RepID=UPI0036D1A7E5
MNRHMLRLAGPMQSRGERSTFNPDGDTAPFPTLLGVLAAAQSITGQDTSALNHHAAPEFSVRTDRPDGRLFDYHPPRGDQLNNQNATTRDARRNRHAHRVPGYRPHTLPTTLIDYATKEAAA